METYRFWFCSFATKGAFCFSRACFSLLPIDGLDPSSATHEPAHKVSPAQKERRKIIVMKPVGGKNLADIKTRLVNFFFLVPVAVTEQDLSPSFSPPKYCSTYMIGRKQGAKQSPISPGFQPYPEADHLDIVVVESRGKKGKFREERVAFSSFLFHSTR